ncbi:hypothetical protein KUCAC02_003779, partial [Chaenocephalus aceratus]
SLDTSEVEHMRREHQHTLNPPKGVPVPFRSNYISAVFDLSPVQRKLGGSTACDIDITTPH